MSANKPERVGGDEAIATEEKEQLQAILDDPETRDWLQKKGVSYYKADSKKYDTNAILDDPELRDWLAKKKEKHVQISEDTREPIEAILDDPETVQWLMARKDDKKNKTGDKDAIRAILNDPATRDWLAKRVPGEASVQRPQILSYLDDITREGFVLESGENTQRALPYLTRQQRLPAPEIQPGAYTGAPGAEPQRRDNVRFAHLGTHPAEEPRVQENGIQLAPSGGGGLAEAMPVEEDPVPDMEAQPVDIAAAEKRQAEANARTKRNLLLGMGLSLLVLVGVIVLVVAVKQQDKKDGSVQAPTPTPSAILSEYPSLAPSGALDVLMEGLPDGTLESLQRIDTPQWKALNWLEYHPGLFGMMEWRKKQLFALAIFFFAMGGEAWPKDIKDTWLQYCTTQTSAFGFLEYLVQWGRMETTNKMRPTWTVALSIPAMKRMNSRH